MGLILINPEKRNSSGQKLKRIRTPNAQVYVAVKVEGEEKKLQRQRWRRRRLRWELKEKKRNHNKKWFRTRDAKHKRLAHMNKVIYGDGEKIKNVSQKRWCSRIWQGGFKIIVVLKDSRKPKTNVRPSWWLGENQTNNKKKEKRDEGSRETKRTRWWYKNQIAEVDDQRRHLKSRKERKQGVWRVNQESVRRTHEKRKGRLQGKCFKR